MNRTVHFRGICNNMVLETETRGVKVRPQRQQDQLDHEEEELVAEMQKSRSFYDKVREQVERFASTKLGQVVMERGDYTLRIVEETARWSLPQEKNAIPLERPLSWVPFLMLIILLRLTRFWLSVGALIIGNGPVSPAQVIYFIQTRRRKLRAIRVHGLKMIRQRQQEVSCGTGKGLMHKLTQWFSLAMCRPGVQRNNSGRIFQTNHVDQNTSAGVQKRPREEETTNETEANLTISELIAKYANENSEDDSDFVPNPEEENESSGETSSSSESSTSEQINSDDEPELKKDQPKVLLVKGDSNELQDKDKEKHNGEQEQTGVAPAQLKEEEQWKDTPNLLNAALMNTNSHLYNNTAAAVHTDPDPVPAPDSVSPPPNPNEDYSDDTDSSSGCTVYQQDSQKLTNYPTIDTLTPATSSEDIFYSPIGSPTNFNSYLGMGFQPILKTATSPFVMAHSTPTSEADDQHSATSDLEEATRANISLAHQAEHKPNQQQQQHKYHPKRNAPARGRNRR